MNVIRQYPLHILKLYRFQEKQLAKEETDRLEFFQVQLTIVVSIECRARTFRMQFCLSGNLKNHKKTKNIVFPNRNLFPFMNGTPLDSTK